MAVDATGAAADASTVVSPARTSAGRRASVELPMAELVAPAELGALCTLPLVAATTLRLSMGLRLLPIWLLVHVPVPMPALTPGPALTSVGHGFNGQKPCGDSICADVPRPLHEPTIGAGATRVSVPRPGNAWLPRLAPASAGPATRSATGSATAFDPGSATGSATRSATAFDADSVAALDTTDWHTVFSPVGLSSALMPPLLLQPSPLHLPPFPPPMPLQSPLLLSLPSPLPLPLLAVRLASEATSGSHCICEALAECLGDFSVVDVFSAADGFAAEVAGAPSAGGGEARAAGRLVDLLACGGWVDKDDFGAKCELVPFLLSGGLTGQLLVPLVLLPTLTGMGAPRAGSA